MIKFAFNLKINLKRWLLIILGLSVLVLFALVVGEMFDISSRTITKNLGSFLVEGSLNSVKREFHESDSEYPIVVGDSFVSWQELDQTIEFEKLLWKNGTLDWQLKGLVFKKDYEKKVITDLLLERKIIEQIVKTYQFSDLTSNEIEKAKIGFWGQDYKKLNFSFHPEMEARAITRALKTKIDKELVRRYSGVFIHVKFRSQGASEFKDARATALKKTSELHQKAENGLDLNSLVELANNDPEIILLNDNLLQKVFDNFSLDDFSIPSLEIGETIKDMVLGQTSQVFEMTAPMDTNPQKYPFAYGFLKIDKITGSAQNLVDLIQDIKDSLKIEININ